MADLNDSNNLESPVLMDLAAAVSSELSLLPVDEDEGTFCMGAK